MSLLEQFNFNKCSGLIHELTRISSELIRSILKGHHALKGKIENVDDLHRLIVHADPHLDEYFAALLYRGCLPPFKRDIDFIEQATYSEDNDIDLISLGPNSAAFGFGGQASGGATFLSLFDEHLKGTGRTERSCSEIVANTQCQNLPFSIRVILEEINRIDSNAGAHPQHLNNIIKTFHNVRFLFKSSNSKRDEQKGYLSAVWKRAIVDASVAAVVYCTENRIDLLKVTDEKAEVIRESFTHYSNHSPHKTDPYFSTALDDIKKNAFNLKKTFYDSDFQDGKPQVLILPRIIYACEKAWGHEFCRFVSVHYWETIVQAQIIFLRLLDDIRHMHSLNQRRVTGTLGTIDRITINDHSFHQVAKVNEMMALDYNASLNLYEIAPVPSAIGAHKSISYFLNGKDFKGFGFILVNDKFNGTKAIFKGNGIPEAIWKKVIDRIRLLEPGLWYEVNSSAPFILNGNKTHQYIPPSEIDIEVLASIVRSIK